MLNKKEQDFFYKKLGELIRSARKRADLNQQDLANFLELKRTSIVNIEQGTQRIQLHSLVEISVLLKIDPAELLAKLFVVVNRVETSNAEKRAITKGVAELDDKVTNSEILESFLKFTKYKS